MLNGQEEYPSRRSMQYIVDEVERAVTIQLDGEEFTIEFLDVLPWDDTTDHDIELTADAYVVIYSVIDRTTFDAAVQSLYKLRHGLGIDRPIVLVGNKIDLVRKRKLKKEDVRSISRTYDCIPFETSPDDYTEPEMRRRDKKGPGGFLGKLYRRLSRKGRPKK
ncbi:GTP-binding protein RAD-like [Mercenaria mercenaria]|uniref:GTP-binding protein RAD-like n=1 Tax=Mercenaria mercenaria TaxID=6596 RepID=UPI00234EC194|nr:GTP-binding protein RAD-like [Mercenaria mercenaria]